MAAQAVSRPGDVWNLGRHRLFCGDARNREHYVRLLQSETVDLIFTDPPYNVPIDGHVCGLGRIGHREFAMGVGKMSREVFTGFLTETLGAMASVCRDSTIALPSSRPRWSLTPSAIDCGGHERLGNHLGRRLPCPGGNRQSCKFRSLSALAITDTELSDIARAATMGLSRMPNAG